MIFDKSRGPKTILRKTVEHLAPPYDESETSGAASAQELAEVRNQYHTSIERISALEKELKDVQAAAFREAKLSNILVKKRDALVEILRAKQEKAREALIIAKAKNDELKKRLNHAKAHVDARTIAPLQHNSKEGMDAFFANSVTEKPYAEFAAALRTLLHEKAIDLTGKNVFDAGVGAGNVLDALTRGVKTAKLAGLDFSEVAVNKARQRIPHGVFTVGSLYDPLPGKHDVILCTEVLEHLEQPEKALRNILMALEPGGLAFLTVPDGRVDYSLYHINFWSPESWPHFIRSCCSAHECTFGQFKVKESSRYRNNYALVSSPRSEVSYPPAAQVHPAMEEPGDRGTHRS